MSLLILLFFICHHQPSQSPDFPPSISPPPLSLPLSLSACLCFCHVTLFPLTVTGQRPGWLRDDPPLSLSALTTFSIASPLAPPPPHFCTAPAPPLTRLSPFTYAGTDKYLCRKCALWEADEKSGGGTGGQVFQKLLEIIQPENQLAILSKPIN